MKLYGIKKILIWYSVLSEQLVRDTLEHPLPGHEDCGEVHCPGHPVGVDVNDFLHNKR